MRASFLRLGQTAAFLSGAAVVVFLLLAGGEAFLRWSPPRDFRPYLAERSGIVGPFRADEQLVLQYRSWQVFEDDYRERLSQLRPELSSPRAWAMFGNSFVHMQGMLADTTRATLPDRPVFNLGRNEPLTVRLAQIELLLSHGMKPERLFFILLPHDGLPFAKHSLDQIRITPEGGIAYVPRRPRFLTSVLDTSRLALLAWVRTGRQEAVPDLKPSSINDQVHPSILADFRRLLSDLAEMGRRHGVPITVVLIPNHEQITRGARFGFQDAITSVGQETGLDVCDVRGPFLSAQDKASLFIPDKHFSARGNRLLLDSILTHLSSSPSPTRITRGGTRP